MIATVIQTDSMVVRDESDLMVIRNKLRQHCKQLGMSLVDETKLVTAVSELSRNMILYAGGGIATIEEVNAGGRQGVRVKCEDHGPGIADISQAMKDGFSTINGLGLGLPGAKRLVNEFELNSVVGGGTSVTVTRWK